MTLEQQIQKKRASADSLQRRLDKANERAAIKQAVVNYKRTKAIQKATKLIEKHYNRLNMIARFKNSPGRNGQYVVNQIKRMENAERISVDAIALAFAYLISEGAPVPEDIGLRARATNNEKYWD